MADSLEDQIGAILSDPEQMKQISALAQNLMGQASSEEEQTDLPSEGKGLLTMLMGSHKGGKSESSSEALLKAMKPYLRPERQSKLDKAIRLTRMLRLAGNVMEQYGTAADGI